MQLRLMQTPTLSPLLLALALTACGNPALMTREMPHAGHTRSWHVYLPPGLPASLPPGQPSAPPLVIALHGGGGTGDGFDGMTRNQLTQEAAKRGIVVVFAEGIEKGWNDGRPAISARDKRRAEVDDVAFITALIDRLVADHGIDRRRVYLTGISNGGFMAQRYAIEESHRVAAAAAVTAQVAQAWADRVPARPVPMLIMNGTEDPLVPYAGGQVTVFGEARGAVLSTADSVVWWARHNRCEGAPEVTALPDTDPDDDTHATVERHGTCADASEVLLVRIEGGGHTWPGGKQYLPRGMIGRASGDVQGAAVIFDFFSRHRLPDE